MKNQVFFASVACLALLSLVNACQKPTMEEPVIRLSLKEVPVPPEGGDFDIAFQISDATGDGRVSVELSDATTSEWVTGLSVDEDNSLINIHVEPNKTPATRTASVVVSYPGVKDAEFTVSQDAGTPDPFTFTLKKKSYDSFTYDLIPLDNGMSYFTTVTTRDYLESYGLTTDEALYQDDIEYFGDNFAGYLVKGDKRDVTSGGLVPATDYVAYAYGVDPKTLERLTDIVYLDVLTDQVEMIDVDFGIDVAVTGAKFTLSVNPGTYDGYWTAMCFKSSAIDPDVSLFDICSYEWNNSVANYKNLYQYTSEMILSALCLNGSATDLTFSNISPDTEYTVVVFAVNSDAFACSDVSTASVRTGQGVQATVNFELQFDDYYDIDETAKAFAAAGYKEDAAYLASLANVDCLMPATAVTNPKVGTFYYVILEDKPENYQDDATYISFLQSYGSSQESVFFTLSYDMPLFAVGVAFDDYGNAGPVWKSESFTLTADGVSDPQGFLDYIYPPVGGTTLKSLVAAPKADVAIEKRPAASKADKPVFLLPAAEDMAEALMMSTAGRPLMK